MNWRDEDLRDVESLPSDVRAAVGHSSDNWQELLRSDRCGCFHCCATFSMSAIRMWADAARTGLCPVCGFDTVLGDASGFEPSVAFLSRMKGCWF